MERRGFLGLVVAGAAVGSATCVGCASETKERISGPVSGGNARDIPVGHFAFVAGQPVVLARDAEGLYALSSICTHQDCDMAEEGSITTSGLSCDCHGSRFDKDGNVVRGPARTPLEHYRVDVAADGAITIQGGAVVGASVRTQPPSA